MNDTAVFRGLRAAASIAFLSSAAASLADAQVTSELDYLGNISASDDNWFFHPDWGWMYATGDGGSGVFLVAPGSTWFWTSSTTFPYVWDYELESWLYSMAEAEQRRWFYNFDTALWERDSMTAPPVMDLSAALEAYVDSTIMPSISAAFFVDGRLAARGYAGSRRYDQDIPVTMDDIYHNGSLTKSMTATVAARLVEDGLIAWDTTLGEVFDDMTGMDSAWQATTLQMLLSHTSGAAGTTTNSSSRWWDATDPLDEQRRTLVMEDTATPPPNPQGQYLYSNSGYIYAGAMLEEVTGKTWETLMQEELFEPRHLTSAGFGPAGTEGQNDQPLQHYVTGQTITVITPESTLFPSDNPPILGPAGRVHMSVTELAQYATLHAGGPNGYTSYLPAALFEKLHTPIAVPPGYALGWINDYYTGYGDESVWHNGSNTYNYAALLVAPEYYAAGAVVTNIASAETNQAVETFLAAELAALLGLSEAD